MTCSVLIQAQRAVTDSVLTSFCLIVSVFIRTSSEQNSSGLSCAYLQLISPDVFGVKRKLLVIILILFNCNFYFTLGFSLRVCSAFLMSDMVQRLTLTKWRTSLVCILIYGLHVNTTMT